eukprot:2857413-Rhodomonas_salina.1
MRGTWQSCPLMPGGRETGQRTRVTTWGRGKSATAYAYRLRVLPTHTAYAYHLRYLQYQPSVLRCTTARSKYFAPRDPTNPSNEVRIG